MKKILIFIGCSFLFSCAIMQQIGNDLKGDFETVVKDVNKPRADNGSSQASIQENTQNPREDLDPARVVSYLTEEEKNVILEMNRVRANPGGYARQYLEPLRNHYEGNIFKKQGQTDMLTTEGITALNDCIAYLEPLTPRNPLWPSLGLSKAALDHAKDQGRSGATGHDGSDGSDPFTRMTRYGKWTVAGENISYGCSTAREIVIQLLIDDGVPSRGHRLNIMSPVYRTAGISIGTHPKYGYCCVIDYAGVYEEH